MNKQNITQNYMQTQDTYTQAHTKINIHTYTHNTHKDTHTQTHIGTDTLTHLNMTLPLQSLYKGIGQNQVCLLQKRFVCFKRDQEI